MRLLGKTVNRMRNLSRKGFTFLEVIVVVAILILLATIIIVRYKGQVDQAKVDRTRIQIKQVEQALETYYLNNGNYPTQEQGLKALVEQPEDDPVPKKWKKLFDEIPKDSWGQEFIYIIPGEHKEYDLFSKGPDRSEDTEDDIVNWKTDKEKQEEEKDK